MRLSTAKSTPMGQLSEQRRQFVHLPKTMSFSSSSSSSVWRLFAPTHQGKTLPVQSKWRLKILRMRSAFQAGRIGRIPGIGQDVVARSVHMPQWTQASIDPAIWRLTFLVNRSMTIVVGRADLAHHRAREAAPDAIAADEAGEPDE
jgi:hypothetical protein